MNTNTKLTIDNYYMNICMIAGPSGQGKTYLESMLLANKGKHSIEDGNNKPSYLNFRKIIQCTTRRKRPTEKLNPFLSYLFVNKDKYDEMNNEGVLFGRTSIDYNNKKGKYTDYYGSIIPINDIAKAFYKEKFYGEKTVFTVILNAKGIEDLLKFLDREVVNLEKDGITINNLTFNLFGINVDGNNGLLRKDRNPKYVEEERKSLEQFKDYFTFSFFNDFKENKHISEEDIENLAYDIYSILKECEN